MTAKVAARHSAEHIARRQASNVRRPCVAPARPQAEPLGRNAQPISMRAGIQLSPEVWKQEFEAGARDRQIAQVIRQDTTIRRIQKDGQELICATNQNRCDPAKVKSDWDAEANQRALWLLASHGKLLSTDDAGNLYVVHEGERVYAPRMVMPTGTICARFLDYADAGGRKVKLSSPIKRTCHVKRVTKGATRRVIFTQGLDNMPSDAYAKGYDQGIAIQREQEKRARAERVAAAKAQARTPSTRSRGERASKTPRSMPSFVHLPIEDMIAAF